MRDVPCVFPFIYKGKTYNSCTYEDFGNVAWCSVATDEDNNHIRDHFGKCTDSENCDIPPFLDVIVDY